MLPKSVMPACSPSCRQLSETVPSRQFFQRIRANQSPQYYGTSAPSLKGQSFSIPPRSVFTSLCTSSWLQLRHPPRSHLQSYHKLRARILPKYSFATSNPSISAVTPYGGSHGGKYRNPGWLLPPDKATGLRRQISRPVHSNSDTPSVSLPLSWSRSPFPSEDPGGANRWPVIPSE